VCGVDRNGDISQLTDELLRWWSVERRHSARMGVAATVDG
jgi:hypothetical protein